MITKILRNIYMRMLSLFKIVSNRKKNILPGYFERKRITKIQHRKVFSTRLLGKYIQISDSKWYLPTIDEIWGKQIYKFAASNDSPYIIDCGANVGLSVIYWKYLYPKSRIIAFEPDPLTFDLLQKNTITFGFENIDLRPYAVWSSNARINFQPDNSVGGRITENENFPSIIEVSTYRLRDLLRQKIDMLKIDIEGAEIVVLEDCGDQLSFVENLFVEYHGRAGETQKLHQILSLIHHYGFRYHIKEANPIEHPFIKTELGKFYDLQLNIFAFRS